MSAGSPALAASKPQARSRVTNGKSLLAGVDARSAWARRFRDLVAVHVADLGGAEAASAAEQSIVRRAAAITVELERLESKFAGEGRASAEDLDLYQRAAGNLRRLLESVGLERRQRDVTPSLQQYLAGKAAETAVCATTVSPDADQPERAENRVSGDPSRDVGGQSGPGASPAPASAGGDDCRSESGTSSPPSPSPPSPPSPSSPPPSSLAPPSGSELGT